ncbi:DNA alkylation repair protein [Rickettsia oklahomensis]|uniref:DNA alkylation repair protein n=1 Tax=Rickettsia oklahomensis TaxID=3141789 RepID=A0AAU7BYA6_9RICK
MRENLQQIGNILLSLDTISLECRTLFFKTREGDYGEHDRVIGVIVPTLHKVAKSYYLAIR